MSLRQRVKSKSFIWTMKGTPKGELRRNERKGKQPTECVITSASPLGNWGLSLLKQTGTSVPEPCGRSGKQGWWCWRASGEVLWVREEGSFRQNKWYAERIGSGERCGESGGWCLIWSPHHPVESWAREGAGGRGTGHCWSEGLTCLDFVREARGGWKVLNKFKFAF